MCAGGSNNGGSLSGLRVSYGVEGVSGISKCPLSLLSDWVSEAVRVVKPPHEANAMVLSTVSSIGRPSARVVLLKRLDERGLVWYTHYTSRKGVELSSNPYAACTFWWAELQRSVRVEGVVRRLSAEESDAYFQSRPATSRLGALASIQSEVAENGLDGVKARYDKLCAEHLDSNGEVVKPIDRPAHWGGYLLTPDRVEFWKGREARLHDRLVYTRKAEGVEWCTQRLQP